MRTIARAPHPGPLPASGEREKLDPDALFAPLAAEPALLLAVSGGPDSVALMLLASRWSQRPERTVVATVDHGLRPEAQDEALRVAEWARTLGFAHRLLRWEGRPATRLQERARDARYALLAACARDIDARCAVVTAHHADDQAETILFRLTRGSGVAGLSGMAKASSLDGLKLLRPLLDIPKASLESVCAEAGHPYFRDPSNENPKFARAKLRALAATLVAQGLDREALLRLGRRAARSDAALKFFTAQAQERSLVVSEPSRARFDAEALRALPQEILLRLLEGQIFRLGSKAPRLDRLERATEAVAAALEGRARLKLTLAEVLIEVTDASVTLRRAPPRSIRPRPAAGA
ncbi:MAG TPA: tRNA lysidine(34) synthetase TilS [Methylocystis sp.]|nr:tRNA lysidine(34) synthetase TilS [Methylocystis sp.]